MSRAALHTQSGAGNYPVGGGWGPSSFLNIHHLQEAGRSPASEVGHCPTSPRLWGSHCAQPSCWCIDTPRSHLVVVVIVLSFRAGALTPRMMVRLVCLSGWTGAGQALCDVSASQRRDACIPGLGVVGRLRLSKPATNDPWAGLLGRVGRSGRAPAHRWGFAPPALRVSSPPLSLCLRGNHRAQLSGWCIDTLRS